MQPGSFREVEVFSSSAIGEGAASGGRVGIPAGSRKPVFRDCRGSGWVTAQIHSCTVPQGSPCTSHVHILNPCPHI